MTCLNDLQRVILFPAFIIILLIIPIPRKNIYLLEKEEDDLYKKKETNLLN